LRHHLINLFGGSENEAHNGIAVNSYDLGFQLANIWPKITAHDAYAMARNGKECKTLDFLRWLQLWKRQILRFLPVV
jgi:hypothetical protein